MADYWELFRKAKSYYKGLWRIRCPDLDDREIIFGRRGFDHFLKKNNGRRPIADQIRRFNLLFSIYEIVAGGLVYRDANCYMSLLYEMDDGSRVKLVLIEFRDGTIHFVSIYEM